MSAAPLITGSPAPVAPVDGQPTPSAYPDRVRAGFRSRPALGVAGQTLAPTSAPESALASAPALARALVALQMVRNGLEALQRRDTRDPAAIARAALINLQFVDQAISEISPPVFQPADIFHDAEGRS